LDFTRLANSPAFSLFDGEKGVSTRFFATK